jgi:hypothetical protein
LLYAYVLIGCFPELNHNHQLVGLKLNPKLKPLRLGHFWMTSVTVRAREHNTSEGS